MNEEKIGLNFTKDKQFFDKSKQFMSTTISNSTQISVKYGVLTTTSDGIQNSHGEFSMLLKIKTKTVIKDGIGYKLP